MAATRVQAIVRGRNGRKKASKQSTEREGGWNTGSVRAGFASGGDRNISMNTTMGDDQAAAKLQGLARSRAARKERAMLDTQRNEAATKLQAARRGHMARKSAKAQVAETKDAENKAATRLQTSMRGKAARSEAQQIAKVEID